MLSQETTHHTENQYSTMWDAPGAQNALHEEGHTFTGVVKMIQKTSSVQGGVVRLPLLQKHMLQSGTFSCHTSHAG